MNEAPPSVNYGQWRAPRYEWSSVEEFDCAEFWQDGIHSVVVGDLCVDFLFSGDPLATTKDAIPIFFNGAVQDRASKSAPFFSGSGVASALDLGYIAVADPVVTGSKKLGLAWYMGTENTSLSGSLETLLRTIARRAQRELLLLGGSGGGYAALYYGVRLGSDASVFIWNPQTDVLEYNENFVKDYLSEAFGSSLGDILEDAHWKKHCRERLLSRCTPFAVQGGLSSPRRLLYLQNSSDWHVIKHAAPFLTQGGYTDHGRGLHLFDENHAVVIADFAVDHQPLPQEIIIRGLELMLSGREKDVRSLVLGLRAEGVLPSTDLAKLPRNLRHLRNAVMGELSLAVQDNDGELNASVGLGELPRGYGGIKFAFNLEAEGEGGSTLLRWFSEEPTLNLSAHELGSGPWELKVTIRDGFGSELGRMSAPVELPRTSKIFIYGSCVTRDAFALANPFQLVDYVARSPLSSAFSQPNEQILRQLHLDGIASPFQRRMVEIDTRKQLPELLEQSAFDLLVIDLIDERLQTFACGDSLVTYSSELQSSGFAVEAAHLVRIGTDEYFAKWKDALERLLSICEPSRIVVNKVFWSQLSTDGGPLPSQEQIAHNNSILARLYSILESKEGIRFITYPDELLVADAEHKWGMAPYHYPTATYDYFLRQLHVLSQASLDRPFVDGQRRSDEE